MTVRFTTRTNCQKNRIHKWFNTETSATLYGIQANIAYGEWVHVLEPNGDLILFHTKEGAKAEIKRWSQP